MINDETRRKLREMNLGEVITILELQQRDSDVAWSFDERFQRVIDSAIGKQACKQQIRTRYIRLPDLLVALDEGALVPKGRSKPLKKYCNYGLLIIDE